MDRKGLKLNADLGEGAGNDHIIMPFLSLCNIACGAHAGSKEIIHNTIQLAKKHDVKIGAHPSYPDKENFGRLRMDISQIDLFDSLMNQLQTFRTVAEQLKIKVYHIKAHGALYHAVADLSLIHI